MSDNIQIAIPDRAEISPLTRLPKDTLNAWKTDLSEWTLPGVFRARIDQITQAIPRRIFFGQGGLAFLRDAWIASRLVSALPSDMVRLVSSDRPDFEIQTNERIEQFEATEADMEGRRRGDEPDDLLPRPDPVENWRARFEAIPAAIDRVVAKKLKKNYSPEVSLAIYVNLGCYGAYVEEGLPILRDHTAPAKTNFKRVFVLWEGCLYKLWEDGKPEFEKWSYIHSEDF
ncbi:hypothetical protein [Bradyrhizobium liaoningense]|uniref:hypothetical protein n=1 Tax=Bradyrhizobium liaoningense TaxID=43992 RepID=UPI001BAB6E84|nr:hypothetical protein [Bradyrhizobium liaoningense]MBR0818273.1 hypothetical protein [Bradyrhizobium liaoningense]